LLPISAGVDMPIAMRELSASHGRVSFVTFLCPPKKNKRKAEAADNHRRQNENPFESFPTLQQ
jgi:hypothetical protein